jgi:GNAT superfamily N-acetyltransferase
VIREATVADVPRLLEMGLRFLRESEYAAHIDGDPAQIEQTMRQLIDLEDRAILVTTRGEDVVGMIGLVAYPHPFSGQRAVVELFWWVDPEHRTGGDGIRLLRAAEAWARKASARHIQMIAPNGDVERLYQRLGYTRVEVAFQRSL